MPMTDDPPSEREQLREAIRENGRLRAELILANQRIVALERRINAKNDTEPSP
jgi:hypothetical protein